jgi:hypothetical protein
MGLILIGTASSSNWRPQSAAIADLEQHSSLMIHENRTCCFLSRRSPPNMVLQADSPHFQPFPIQTDHFDDLWSATVSFLVEAIIKWSIILYEASP